MSSVTFDVNFQQQLFINISFLSIFGKRIQQGLVVNELDVTSAPEGKLIFHMQETRNETCGHNLQKSLGRCRVADGKNNPHDQT